MEMFASTDHVQYKSFIFQMHVTSHELETGWSGKFKFVLFRKFVYGSFISVTKLSNASSPRVTLQMRSRISFVNQTMLNREVFYVSIVLLIVWYSVGVYRTICGNNHIWQLKSSIILDLPTANFFVTHEKSA